MSNLILSIDTNSKLHPDDIDQMTDELVNILQELELGTAERVKSEAKTKEGKSVEEFIINQIVVAFAINVASQAAQPYLEQYAKAIWQWTHKQGQRLGQEVSVSLGSAVISSTMTWLMVGEVINTIRLQKG